MVLQWSCVSYQSRNLGMTMASLLQHNPCHTEQSQPEENSLGRVGIGVKNKEETIYLILLFTFH